MRQPDSTPLKRQPVTVIGFGGGVVGSDGFGKL